MLPLRTSWSLGVVILILTRTSFVTGRGISLLPNLRAVLEFWQCVKLLVHLPILCLVHLELPQVLMICSLQLSINMSWRTGTFTGSKTGSTFSTPEGFTTIVTETFYSPSRTLTFTSVIPSETSPLIPPSTQTTTSGPESSSSGTSVSSGGTVPNTTPTPSPSPSGTSASSSASIPTSTSGARHAGDSALGAAILGAVACVLVMWVWRNQSLEPTARRRDKCHGDMYCCVYPCLSACLTIDSNFKFIQMIACRLNKYQTRYTMPFLQLLTYPHIRCLFIISLLLLPCVLPVYPTVLSGVSHPPMAKVEKWNLCRALRLPRFIHISGFASDFVARKVCECSI